ncbi:replication-relaxation family protein [Sporosarcina jeotgali]|uniref:Replication-relaxation family protein n=1 Tax=Sporosarcina jeotgali TaxID=3020056 RepID=A0ABZ0KXU4_9BACL|nr:replication-relaxation family protein [Sporosarcina sp. B2O-1]WOV84722.1 replication-relaxation family protein [Sporosarcina sp. B2O-1]
MSSFSTYNLSDRSNELLKLLHLYRGMTAKQLAKFVFNVKELSTSQEKSIYNYLSALRKRNLVTSYRSTNQLRGSSIFYLSQWGYNYTLDLLDIGLGQSNDGWLPAGTEESSSSEFSYELYTPPLKQLDHHLQLIDFFISIHIFEEENYFSYEVKHRNNLYAAKKFKVDGKVSRYRPDAEILLNGNLFTIEIDRGTESHEQLCAKFETYKKYLELQQDKECLRGIIFVVESKVRNHGVRRRWENILGAFLKVLYKFKKNIKLILTTSDSIEETLLHELNRENYYNRLQYFVDQWNVEYEEIKQLKLGNGTKSNFFIGQSGNKAQLYFAGISGCFDSTFLVEYLSNCNLIPKIEETLRMKGLKSSGVSVIVFTPSSQHPHIPLNLDTFNLNKTITVPLAKISETIEYSCIETYLKIPDHFYKEDVFYE